MRGRCEVPARLLQLERRFRTWRANRKRGERIPERLWKAASGLAAEYGLNQTSSVLKLDYYALKRQMGQPVASMDAESGFIELPSIAVADSTECVIEFEDAAGASMRVHLKGTELPDVLALSRSFWTGQ